MNNTAKILFELLLEAMKLTGRLLIYLTHIFLEGLIAVLEFINEQFRQMIK